MFSGLLLMLAALPAAMAVDVRGTLVGNHVLNSTVLPIDAYVDVDYGVAQVPILADGSFFLTKLATGQHVVRPIVRGYKMTDRLLTVPDGAVVVERKPEAEEKNETEGGEEASSAPNVHVQALIPGRQAQAVGKIASLGLPLEINALFREEYYAPPAGMNILQMLKSPMVLMVLFSGVMAVAMPYMTANMESDPELAREMAAQRKRMQDGMNMDWSGALASRLAGEKTDEGSASPGPGGVTASAPGAGASGGGGSRASPAPAGSGNGGGRGGKRGGKRR